MARFGQHYINDVIACVIRWEARVARLPEFIALGIAGAESSWDPNAIGDNGLSFGLFQLYTGDGQGSPWRNDPSILLNPRFNSRVAISYIKPAYDYCQGLGATGFDLVACTAIGSGHPGPVSVTNPLVQRIVRICGELIFMPDGSWARWPEFNPDVCEHVTVDEVPPPPPREPIAAFEDLDPVEPPAQAEAGFLSLPAVEPPVSV